MVRPRKRAWIETRAFLSSWNHCNVRPRKRAWIETSPNAVGYAVGVFALARGRGLKRLVSTLLDAPQGFALARGRGLKPLSPQNIGGKACVRPRKRAWIETILAKPSTFTRSVRPRKRAWIETAGNVTVVLHFGVRPRKRAWIETLALASRLSKWLRFALARGRGLKHRRACGRLAGWLVRPRKRAWIETFNKAASC